MILHDTTQECLRSNQASRSNTPHTSRFTMCCQMSTPASMASLESTARDDRKFLAFDAQKYLQYQKIEEAARILDYATEFLHYLQHIQSNPSLRAQAAIRHGFPDYLDFEKYLANIEHMVRCIQQAAMDALIQSTLQMLHSDPNSWNRWFEQTQNRTTDWFSEWSSDRPPLNSTMPWNIKASLVVLWGVCWMFYTPNKSINSSRHTPEESWYAQGSNTDWVSQTTVAGSEQVLAYSNPAVISHGQHAEPLLSHTTTTTTQRRRSPSARLGAHESSEIDMIGQMNSGYTQDNMSQHSPALSHMNYSTQLPGPYSQQATPGLDSHKHSIASTAALRSPLTAPSISPHITTADIGPAFATTTSLEWPLPSHTTPHDGFPTHDGIWPSQPKFTDISGEPFYPPSPSVTSYATTTIPSEPLYYLRLPPQNTRPAYRHPSMSGGDPMRSPRSEGSHGGEISPHTSSSSRHNSVVSVEPPRDNYGNMTCDHPKCAKNPPIFTRKCEWKKHKDTHTRPYVCRVPGCEKIQGFTYSGGLLRHEREVHHQHGGPKLPRYCPHKDCKRSTGQGFSRKENLNEHLRRVHRGIGIEDNPRSSTRTENGQSMEDSQTTLQSQHLNSDSLGSRKRKRDPMGGADDHLSPSLSGMGHLMNTVTELRDEVNSLRQEMAIKDARISQLQHALHMQTTGR